MTKWRKLLRFIFAKNEFSPTDWSWLLKKSALFSCGTLPQYLSNLTPRTSRAFPFEGGGGIARGDAERIGNFQLGRCQKKSGCGRRGDGGILIFHFRLPSSLLSTFLLPFWEIRFFCPLDLKTEGSGDDGGKGRTNNFLLSPCFFLSWKVRRLARQGRPRRRMTRESAKVSQKLGQTLFCLHE